MWNLNNNLDNNKGFSLVEMMVALAVLGIAFFGMVKAFPRGLNMNTVSRNKTTASYLAQQKVEKLFSQGYKKIATGTVETKSRISSDPDSYFYDFQRKTVVDYVDGTLTATSGDSGMKRITTTVYYPGNPSKDEQTFRVNTIISKN